MHHSTISLALVPIFSPFIPEHPFLKGPVKLHAVQVALRTYHPLLSYFVDAAAYLQSAPTYCGYHTSFPDSLLPDRFTTSDSVLTAEYTGQSPVHLYRDLALDPYDPRAVVSSRVSCTCEMNLSQYHLDNPVSPQLATQSPPLGSINLQQSSVFPHLGSTDSSSPAEKNVLCRQGYQIIFAAFLGEDAVTRQPTVALFEFSLDFKELLSIPTNTERGTVFSLTSQPSPTNVKTVTLHWSAGLTSPSSPKSRPLLCFT